MDKKLFRSRSDRMIAGVCGGLGEYLVVDPVWLRLLFVVLLVSGGFGFWAYLILWIIVPNAGRDASTPSETVQANVQEMADRAREFGESIQRGIQGNRTPSESSPTSGPTSGPFLVGVAFILVGLVLLLKQFNIFSWFDWGVMWPLLLIVLGGALLFSRVKE
jgi:phage shock protein C